MLIGSRQKFNIFNGRLLSFTIESNSINKQNLRNLLEYISMKFNLERAYRTYFQNNSLLHLHLEAKQVLKRSYASIML